MPEKSLCVSQAVTFSQEPPCSDSFEVLKVLFQSTWSVRCDSCEFSFVFGVDS